MNDVLLLMGGGIFALLLLGFLLSRRLTSTRGKGGEDEAENGVDEVENLL